MDKEKSFSANGPEPTECSVNDINKSNETVIPFEYYNGTLCKDGKVLVIERSKKNYYHKLIEHIYSYPWALFMKQDKLNSKTL